ncbi:1,4-dihydroxy-2-naphthoate polyprenyltransferase [Humidisolicoccus flavus]|uniref:1,4-dihydroxy-2-naphthoate polyprenyltransferase n=1 Tax=Humidisolicoccus flavus TaxID=3111414 RepID=UPI003250671D
MADRKKQTKRGAQSTAKRGARNREQRETVVGRKATARDWIGAARPRTLTMSITPVALGTAAAFNVAGWHLGKALLCLAIALFLQIGVNFANDYSDGIRGTDDTRSGPARLTGGRLAEPALVKRVAIACFVIAALAGLALTVWTMQWWLLAIGAVCILAAWFYTGGKRPYGYMGLGELMAFLFFGIVATAGTTWAQIGRVTEDSLWLGGALGCFAAAILLVNNIRDIDGDRFVGKRTLATFIGLRASKILFAILVTAPFVVLWLYSLALAFGGYVFFSALLAGPAVLIVLFGRSAKDYVLALTLTSLTSLIYGIGLAIAIWGGVFGFQAPVIPDQTPVPTP